MPGVEIDQDVGQRAAVAGDRFLAAGVRTQDRRDADLNGHAGNLLKEACGQTCYSGCAGSNVESNTATTLTSSSVTMPSTMRYERNSTVSGSRVETST